MRAREWDVSGVPSMARVGARIAVMESLYMGVLIVNKKNPSLSSS